MELIEVVFVSRLEVAFFRFFQIVMLGFALGFSYVAWYSYRMRDYGLLLFSVLIASGIALVACLLESAIQEDKRS